jgi:hypothetical protein
MRLRYKKVQDDVSCTNQATNILVRGSTHDDQIGDTSQLFMNDDLLDMVFMPIIQATWRQR